MRGWLDLEPIDIGVYIVSSIIGFIVFMWLRHNLPLAILVSSFLSFHLFLGWLVFTADHETGFSLPIVSTIFTHFACLVIVYLCTAVIRVFSVAGLYFPIYLFPLLRPLRYIIALCIPAIAMFERFWLFSGGKKKKTVPLTAAQVAAAAENAAAAEAATASDYEEWMRYVALQKRPFPKPGSSLKVEYERWLVARAKSRASSATGNPTT
jgi:hypothetical protein